jgi:hypothetical protein
LTFSHALTKGFGTASIPGGNARCSSQRHTAASGTPAGRSPGSGCLPCSGQIAGRIAVLVKKHQSDAVVPGRIRRFSGCPKFLREHRNQTRRDRRADGGAMCRANTVAHGDDSRPAFRAGDLLANRGERV